ncbi:MAG: hypothetical protein AAB290_06125, partial [Candidatus Eisenbacteria bacterium]
MRRLPALLLIAAACGTVLSLGTLAALLHHSGHGAGHLVPPAVRSLGRLAPSPAAAQEVMEFKPVPAESVADVVGPRARRG